MTLRLNHTLERDIASSPQVRAALHARGQLVASAAEQVGRQVAKSYRAEVEQTAEGVRVVANTDGINAAAWIEVGTSKLPVSAPLRKGAESAGLDLRARN